MEINVSMVEVLLGTFLGLAFFAHFPIQGLWRAYMVQAYLMAFGNLALLSAIYFRMPLLFGISRIGIGFQCGCIYNVGLAFLCYSQGRNTTASLLIGQFFVSIGFLLGSILGAVSALIGHAFEMRAEWEALFPICFMAVFGMVLLTCLMITAPPHVGRTRPHNAELAQWENSGQQALVCLLWNFVSISAFQCMFLESGTVFFFGTDPPLAPLDAALAIGNASAANALVVLLVSRFVAGCFNDEAVMRILELVQFIAIFVILLSVGVRRAMGPVFSPMVLGVFAFFHYCASSLHGVFGLAFCLERAVPSTYASQENLLLVSLLALSGGLCVGCGAGHWLRVQLEGFESDPRLYVIGLLLAVLFQSLSRISASSSHVTHKCH